ncbi:MAG: hypothetical protein M3Y08_07550 [Fibrobacterota bacterium]|nr:hypothetical protein [Fibrobacterota bacterium]
MEATPNRNDPFGNFGAYQLDERRTDSYTFTNLKGLVRYFSTWLEEEDIDEVVKTSKVGFTTRTGCDNEETKLQFLKKCEYALVRILRKGPR